MRTRIISAFPGTGKSFYHKNNPKTTIDSDSSEFSWITIEEWDHMKGYVGSRKERNPDFPGNYIQHIKDCIGKYEFIFVSTHKEVRKALLDNCLFFYLIYPNKNQRDLYLQRFVDRGSPMEFVHMIDTNWNAWIKELKFCEYGCQNIQMAYPTLTKELQHIIASEGGDK